MTSNSDRFRNVFFDRMPHERRAFLRGAMLAGIEAFTRCNAKFAGIRRIVVSAKEDATRGTCALESRISRSSGGGSINNSAIVKVTTDQQDCMGTAARPPRFRWAGQTRGRGGRAISEAARHGTCRGPHRSRSGSCAYMSSYYRTIPFWTAMRCGISRAARPGCPYISWSVASVARRPTSICTSTWAPNDLAGSWSERHAARQAGLPQLPGGDVSMGWSRQRGCCWPAQVR